VEAGSAQSRARQLKMMRAAEVEAGSAQSRARQSRTMRAAPQG
jgi:hypothetical protein